MSGRTDADRLERLVAPKKIEKLKSFLSVEIGDIVRSSEYQSNFGEVYFEDFEGGFDVIGVFFQHTGERLDVNKDVWLNENYEVVTGIEKKNFLRTDTVRLEWLWMNSDKAIHLIEVDEGSVAVPFCNDATPFRAAIDAAMNAEEQG